MITTFTYMPQPAALAEAYGYHVELLGGHWACPCRAGRSGLLCRHAAQVEWVEVATDIERREPLPHAEPDTGVGYLKEMTVTNTNKPIASNELIRRRAQLKAQAAERQSAPVTDDELFPPPAQQAKAQVATQTTEQEQPTTPAQFIGAQRVYTVSAVSPAGWPVSIAFADINLKEFEDRLAHLEQRGYRPPASDWPTTPEGLPICRKHGVPMKKREKQGDVWHSHNMGTEKEPCYCRGYAGKDSPGWER